MLTYLPVIAAAAFIAPPFALQETGDRLIEFSVDIDGRANVEGSIVADADSIVSWTRLEPPSLSVTFDLSPELNAPVPPAIKKALAAPDGYVVALDVSLDDEGADRNERLEIATPLVAGRFGEQVDIKCTLEIDGSPEGAVATEVRISFRIDEY